MSISVENEDIIESTGSVGSVKYLYRGLRHNRTGPAYILDSGYREWYVYGELHRDGEWAIHTSEGSYGDEAMARHGYGRWVDAKYHSSPMDRFLFFHHTKDRNKK